MVKALIPQVLRRANHPGTADHPSGVMAGGGVGPQMGDAGLGEGADVATNAIDALVIFGVTGDLAKLETFPALVGPVQPGVLDVPAVGVAKSGWGLQQFRDYADVVRNHRLQVLAAVLADPPGGQGLGSWRDAESRVLSALRPLTAEDTVRDPTRLTGPEYR
jgi:hypothetical protein